MLYGVLKIFLLVDVSSGHGITSRLIISLLVGPNRFSLKKVYHANKFENHCSSKLILNSELHFGFFRRSKNISWTLVTLLICITTTYFLMPKVLIEISLVSLSLYFLNLIGDKMALLSLLSCLWNIHTQHSHRQCTREVPRIENYLFRRITPEREASNEMLTEQLKAWASPA